MYDTHIHTNNSHDSKQTIDEVCQSAIEKGVKAISLTDHIDVFAYTEERNSQVICGTSKDAEYAKKTYGNDLMIFTGVEMGLYHYDIAMSKKLCNLIEPDIILGSVHSFMLDDEKVHFSKDVITAEAVPTDKLIKQVDKYFDEMLLTAETADIDVLCHLTYPMRYINGSYNRGLELDIYTDKIKKILQTIIKRNIALEINTARLGSDFDYPAPTFDIVKKHFDLGGRLVTIGSDAHTPSKITNGFDFVKSKLKDIGYNEYFYYDKRCPKSVKLGL